jgi:hypothetical protein
MESGLPHSIEINFNGKIITKTPTTIEPIKNKQGKFIMTHVPAKHANRDCACAQAYKNNNLPSLHFSNICKPASLTMMYEEDDDLPSLTAITNVKKQHESHSNVYYSVQSTEGFITPHLAQRSSINTIERENIQDHGQIWSNVNFTANPKVAADLMSNMCRPEYKHYTKNILRKEGFSYLPHLHRYRSL